MNFPDGSGNTAMKNYQLTVGSGTARSLTYDANGNLLDDGAGNIYGWDAANRLVKITQTSGVTEFVYDGAGRRVREKLDGALSKQWIWCGGPQPCEERDASNNVTKRFYEQGEQIGGSAYFFTRDHLGSVREMTDTGGTVRARYDYDPYGRTTKVSGDLEADFGFTGFYRHQSCGLSLTLFRAYDSGLGRWLSRDPIGEAGGINLYGYVGNDPINMIDPLGLAWEGTVTQGYHYNDRKTGFGFAVEVHANGKLFTKPLGGKSHTYNAKAAEKILADAVKDPQWRKNALSTCSTLEKQAGDKARYLRLKNGVLKLGALAMLLNAATTNLPELAKEFARTQDYASRAAIAAQIGQEASSLGMGDVGGVGLYFILMGEGNGK